MAILYAVVARGTVVLAEFSAVTGNTGTVARRILEKLPSEADSRLCFSQDTFVEKKTEIFSAVADVV
ncbi:vesicle-associated membrane protein 714 [Quercus suber]|uniref:Vesicle-associated membrane protein 714 n=1 Tax=Quercus suber TaxID=58331 RepID=A0AAW0KVJ8_QUESU